jgi:hypothetical protein
MALIQRADRVEPMTGQNFGTAQDPLVLPPFTNHATRRYQQRAVPQWAIGIALRARPRFSRGCLVYCVTDRFLLRQRLDHLADRLRGLTVVVSPDSAIVTLKWDNRLRRGGCLRRSRLEHILDHRFLSLSEPAICAMTHTNLHGERRGQEDMRSEMLKHAGGKERA